jgi:hypothetical protein
MNGRDDHEPVLSLDEAVELWTPKEIWQRYRQMAEVDIPLVNPWDPLQEEARRLRGQIERILTDKLYRGELIASGLALPLHPTTRRRDVSRELWSRLQLNIRRQQASGDGLTWVELRFREAGPASTERPPATPKQAQPRRRRSAGRPSIMKEIKAEMRRRAARGELAPSLKAETEALAEWAAAEERLASQRIPKPTSIQRKLSSVYQSLRSDKKSR